MADDIVVNDDELLEAEEKLRILLSSVEVARGSLRTARQHQADEILRQIHQHLNRFSASIRLVHGDEKHLLEKKMQTHQSTLVSLRDTLRMTRAVEPATTPSLSSVLPSQKMPPDGRSTFNVSFSGHSAAAADDGYRDEQQHLQERVSLLQDSTLASLNRTEKLVCRTEEIGHTAATTLAVQTEQIHHYREELDGLRSELDLAAMELNRFLRRVACDRVVLCFAVAITLCIGGVTAVLLIKGMRVA